MGIGIDCKQIDYRKTVVAINGSGAGTQAVTFDDDYVVAPSILVVPNEADAAGGASYTAASATISGFTLTVTGSNRTSRDIEIFWFAHEKD